MPGELYGVGLVTNRVDDFETDLGADGAADELSAGIGGFAKGGLIIDFLNEQTIGQAAVEGGGLREDFGDLEQLGFFIDAKSSADTSELKDHVGVIFFGERKALQDGPADGRGMAVCLIRKDYDAASLFFVEANESS